MNGTMSGKGRRVEIENEELIKEKVMEVAKAIEGIRVQITYPKELVSEIGEDKLIEITNAAVTRVVEEVLKYKGLEGLLDLQKRCKEHRSTL
jgi:hypothetical protein